MTFPNSANTWSRSVTPLNASYEPNSVSPAHESSLSEVKLASNQPKTTKIKPSSISPSCSNCCSLTRPCNSSSPSKKRETQRQKHDPQPYCNLPWIVSSDPHLRIRQRQLRFLWNVRKTIKLMRVKKSTLFIAMKAWYKGKSHWYISVKGSISSKIFPFGF